jgi:hypothetical protein
MGSGALPGVVWAIVALGLLWLAIAVAMAVLAARRFRTAEAVLGVARSTAALLDQAPARPLVVRPDGRVEVDGQLLRELGLPAAPERLGDLAGVEAGA